MSINRLHRLSQDGGKESAEQLFQSLTARFRVFVRQRVWNEADADEIVQEALVTICREYRKTEFETSFAAWAYKVLDNRILAFVSKRKRRSEREVPAGEPSDIQATMTQVDRPQLKAKLLSCLRKVGRVNRRYVRVLNFCYQGYKTAEICRRMDVKPNTLYSLLSRARRMLETCLDKGDIK
ncbi:MAG: sigma-70 family RNA polymerase sigma factor [bacterium]|nr:sigma-70 family RNA polymerase sigma factor [bacterium]